MIIHVVQSGDTLTSIASQYGVSASRIQLENQLPNPNQLLIGQDIVIQYTAITHTVVAGDTTLSIAKQYNTTVNDILQNNPHLILAPTLYIGQTVVIEYTGKKLGKLSVGGYVYAYVNRNTLLRTLPFLTYLNIFAYGFKTDGTLIPSNDTELIPIARTYGVAPFMVFSSLGEDGTFSDVLAHELLTNMTLQNKVIDNLIAQLKEKNYYGIDVDIEFIFPDDKQAYIDFIKNLRDQLNPEGLQVSVALAPKTSATQAGTLYEGHSYEGLGAAANMVLLMTYEWGYT